MGAEHSSSGAEEDDKVREMAPAPPIHKASTSRKMSSANQAKLSTARAIKSFELSPVQIKQIQKLWHQLKTTKGDNYAGSMVFEKIFVKSPEAKQLFVNIGVKGVSQYKSHYSKFSDSLDFVINNLEDMGKISERLTELGRRHVNIRSRGFDPKLWDIFAESMIACTLMWGEKQQRSNITQEGWTKIVLFIIDRMREGYQREIKLRYQESIDSGSFEIDDQWSPVTLRQRSATTNT